MNGIQLRALQYVKNTNRGATKDIFIEDHEPIGKQLWYDLVTPTALIAVDAEGKVVLTEAGELLLQKEE